MKQTLLFVCLLLCGESLYGYTPSEGSGGFSNGAPRARIKVTPQEIGLQTIHRAAAEAHIGFLADDALRGREAGTQEGHIAGNDIAAYLHTIGIKPLFDTYVQSFDAYCAERQQRKRFQVHPDSVAALQQGTHQKLSMRNVLGVIEGKNPQEIVIIGAHYDHLGMDVNLVGDAI